jgi:hypothetical protein
MPRVIRGLHSSPNPSAVAKELAEPNGNSWRNWLTLIQNVVKVLARNSDETGNFRLAPPGGRDQFVAKQCARMRRAPIRIALCRIDHLQSPSVVLFEIHAIGIAAFEFECDAPWSINMDRIADWIESLERVKVEAGNVHFLRPHRNVEAIQPRKDPFMQLRINLRSSSFSPQLGEAFAFKGPDHDPM